MATALTRSVARETAAVDGRTGKNLLIKLKEGGKVLEIWTKGSHQKYTATYDQLWNWVQASRMHAAAQMQRESQG